MAKKSSFSLGGGVCSENCGFWHPSPRMWKFKTLIFFLQHSSSFSKLRLVWTSHWAMNSFIVFRFFLKFPTVWIVLPEVEIRFGCIFFCCFLFNLFSQSLRNGSWWICQWAADCVIDFGTRSSWLASVWDLAAQPLPTSRPANNARQSSKRWCCKFQLSAHGIAHLPPIQNVHKTIFPRPLQQFRQLLLLCHAPSLRLCQRQCSPMFSLFPWCFYLSHLLSGIFV